MAAYWAGAPYTRLRRTPMRLTATMTMRVTTTGPMNGLILLSIV